MADENVVLETVVGSHAWGMDHEGSDLDLFRVKVTHAGDILRGEHGGVSSSQSSGPERDVDVVTHSAGKVVEQLLKGNVNYVLGVLSPLPQEALEHGRVLRDLVRGNLSVSTYWSVQGLCHSNYDKYYAKDKDRSRHRAAKVKRIHDFGVRLLRDEEVVFEDPRPCTWDDFDAYNEDGRWVFPELEGAYEDTSLPESPPEEPFRNWLMDARIEHWDAEVHDVY